jgi:hypothetical protein
MAPFRSRCKYASLIFPDVSERNNAETNGFGTGIMCLRQGHLDKNEEGCRTALKKKRIRGLFDEVSGFDFS